MSFNKKKEKREIIPREEVAAFVHEKWANWMRYMFSKNTKEEIQTSDPKSVGIFWTAEQHLRWQRQMETPYKALPEEEKESDRKIADEIIELIQNLYINSPLFFEDSENEDD